VVKRDGTSAARGGVVKRDGTSAARGGVVKVTLAARGLRVVRGARVVLRDVDLAAEGGEVVGLLGPSGAGKSTLFRAITGDLDLDAGSVFLDGHDITTWPLWRRARRGIGYMPQEPSVLWDLTVRQNLEVFREIARGASSDPLVAAKDVALEDRLDVKAGELSAGERRRLEFARAVTRPVRVLVCDEPFAGVDPAGAARLGELLAGVAKRGAAVLLADHHVPEALRVCTRAVLLLDGSIAASGSPEAFRDHPLVRARYLDQNLGPAPS
jgi:lipopolysaccharide export system ATP-binding protein